jgi:hypothetical protein
MDDLNSNRPSMTPLKLAFEDLCKKFELFAQLNEPLMINVAGGMAVHLHNCERITACIDAQFEKKVHVPNDLSVIYKDKSGRPYTLRFNTAYNPDHSLLPRSYIQRCMKIEVGTVYLQQYVLGVNDLIISKISRFSQVDQDDIGLLASHPDCDLQVISLGIEEALSQIVGSTKQVRQNADRTLQLVERSRTLRE